jgi:CPA1 family monovalent cation:H+ antiporter
MSAAAIAAIDDHLARAKAPLEWADHLRAETADLVTVAAPARSKQSSKDALSLRLRRVAIKAKREELIRLWRDNEISDEVMRVHEEILDYQEAQSSIRLPCCTGDAARSTPGQVMVMTYGRISSLRR